MLYFATYPTVSLVPPISTIDVYSGITYSANLTGPLKRKIQSTVTTADSCDGGISVLNGLNHCLLRSEFVNTHLSHASQWFNIHITRKTIYLSLITNTKLNLVNSLTYWLTHKAELHAYKRAIMHI